MTVAKVIEISASSTKSFEDAINIGISRATDSVNDRVSMQVTFIVAESSK